MKQDNFNRPLIAPVPANIDRPLWSVMIPTYNCAKYLRKTLESVLAQDPGSDIMQITVVDDHSTEDDPAAIVEELGHGRVEFYQQPQNVGSPKNFQTCLELARGKLVHQLHGDDFVLDGFYQKMQRPFLEHPEIGAAFCRTLIIDEELDQQYSYEPEQLESGILPSSWLSRIASMCIIHTPTMVVRREVYEKLGGFDYRLQKSHEDWEMWVRIAANYPIWYEVEPLAAYRIHFPSNLQSNLKNGIVAREAYKASNIIQAYLSDKVSKKIFKQAKQNAAYKALGAAESLINNGELRKGLIQIQAALKYSPTFQVARSACRIFLWNGTRSLVRTAYGKARIKERNRLKT